MAKQRYITLFITYTYLLYLKDLINNSPTVQGYNKNLKQNKLYILNGL